MPTEPNGPNGPTEPLHSWSSKEQPVAQPTRQQVLTALLDVLIPPFDGLGGAGELGLANSVAEDAAASPRFSASLATVLDALMQTSWPTDVVAREALVRSIEERAGAAFGEVVNLAYTNYYTDDRVLAMIERHTGYRARPPQPDGYELEPFNPALLAMVTQRTPRAT